MFRAHTCTMSCKLSVRTCPSSTTYLFQCSENHDFLEFGMQNNCYWYAQIFYKFCVSTSLSQQWKFCSCRLTFKIYKKNIDFVLKFDNIRYMIKIAHISSMKIWTCKENFLQNIYLIIDYYFSHIFTFVDACTRHLSEFMNNNFL